MSKIEDAMLGRFNRIKRPEDFYSQKDHEAIAFHYFEQGVLFGKDRAKKSSEKLRKRKLNKAKKKEFTSEL